jgi:hypothetical protein
MREARGRIDWPATHKERITHGHDQSIVVIAKSDRHTDLPENRSLAYTLRCITEAAAALPRGHEATRRGLEAQSLLSNSALASVKIPYFLSGSDRQALRLSRVREFREDVTAVLELHDALQSNDLGTLKALLGERIWLPPEADKLFELWVLFTTVRTLEEKGSWKIRKLSLMGIMQGYAPTFELEKDGKVLRLAYQTMPPALASGSRYQELLDTYALSGASRRPDILVVVPRKQGALSFIIEAKLSEDRDYLLESAYKVLAYTLDFEGSLKDTPFPKAALVVWDGISQPEIVPTGHPIVLLKASSVRNGALVPIIQSLTEAAAESEE